MIDQDGKLIARPHPDPIGALREIAPEWANFACFDLDGELIWQVSRGYGSLWFCGDRTKYQHPRMADIALARTAINLHTHSVYLQQPDGTVIEVSRGEWDV